MVVVGVVVTTLDKVGSDSELMESSKICREIGFKVQIFSDLTVVAVGFGVVNLKVLERAKRRGGETKHPVKSSPGSS